MIETSPSYFWYPKDIMSSGRVAALTPLEELWYRRALDQSWLHVGMPADPKEFAGWVGRRCTVKAAEKIIATFFTKRLRGSKKVFNKKQELLRTEMRTYRKSKSDSGKLSGVSRRNKRDLDIERNANETRTKTNSSSSSSSSSSFDLNRLILRTHAREKNADKDPRLIEIGILYTLLNRNGSNEPIKSVAYFQPEIEKVCEDSKGMGSNAIDAAAIAPA